MFSEPNELVLQCISKDGACIEVQYVSSEEEPLTVQIDTLGPTHLDIENVQALIAYLSICIEAMSKNKLIGLVK